VPVPQVQRAVLVGEVVHTFVFQVCMQPTLSEPAP